MTRIVPAVFTQRQAAEEAVDDLVRAGFPEGAIGRIVPPAGRYLIHGDHQAQAVRAAVTGIAIGVPVFCLIAVGVVWLGSGSWSAIAGWGVLGAAYGGLLGGVFMGGFMGLLLGSRLHDDSDTYADVPDGAAEVAVITHSSRRAKAAHEILARHGASCFLEDAELAS